MREKGRKVKKMKIEQSDSDSISSGDNDSDRESRPRRQIQPPGASDFDSLARAAQAN